MKSIPLILLAAALALAQEGVFRTGQISSRPPIVQPSTFDCAADGAVMNSITGEPIARAHVNVTSGGTVYSTATDSSGKWILSNLGCAQAQLNITRPGFIQSAGNGTKLTMNGGFRPLTLVSGSPVHDIKTELTPQAVAVGKVLDDQGDPVMNAEVMALALWVVDGRPRFHRAASIMTNDLGEYRIANLQRGKYLLCVHLNQNGQNVSQTMAADTCSPGPPEAGAASAMELAAGRETKMDFTLNPVVPVHVRGSITGLPQGRGAGINLVKRVVNADLGTTLPGTVADGKFDFRVPPGSYMLTSDYFDGGKRFFARVPIDVGSSDIDNITVALDNAFTLTGTVQTVTQFSQTPATPQFPINLHPTEPVGSNGQLKWGSDHTSFAINEMVPGSYRLDVFPPAPFYVKSATLAGQDIRGTEVPISQAAGPIEIQLRDDGGSIEGDVADAAGQPVAAGIMLLRNTFRAASLMSQSNGHFKLQNVAPGDYTIYAWDEPNDVEYAEPDWMRRYGGGGIAVTVSAGQSQQVKLTRQSVPAE